MELYSRVLFHMNRTRSARFNRNLHLDPAINIAMLDIINDQYEPIRQQRDYSFERFQRLKASLSGLVRSDFSLSISGNTALKPSDYLYDIGMFVSINNKRKVWSESMQFVEKGPSTENIHERPTPEYPKHMEDQSGFVIKFGGGQNVLNGVYLDYIFKPEPVTSGAELTSSSALTVSTLYGVSFGSVTYNGVNYNQDQAFTTDNVTTAFTGSGRVIPISTLNFPAHLHEELARRAAVILSGNVENYNRRQNKTIEREES